MNVRLAFIVLLSSVLLSSGCTNSLEREGADERYSAISLALSLRTPGDVPMDAETKMTAAITQNGTPFRGIDRLYVIPFQTESENPVADGSARLGDRNAIIHDAAIGTNGLIANNNSHLYDLALLPKNMNWVLAYGKSADDTSPTTPEAKHRNGILNPSGLDNPSSAAEISFSLEPVLETSDEAEVGQITDNLIAALNGVVEALQESNDPEILAFLDAFASENTISACSY